MLGIGGKWDRGAVEAVECEIEVLYDILAWGVLEKMKIHPCQAMPAKVQKAGLYILPHSVQYRPAWPYTSPGACLCGRGRRRVPWPWACLAYSQLYFNYVAVATFCSACKVVILYTCSYYYSLHL